MRSGPKNGRRGPLGAGSRCRRWRHAGADFLRGGAVGSGLRSGGGSGVAIWKRFFCAVRAAAGSGERRRRWRHAGADFLRGGLSGVVYAATAEAGSPHGKWMFLCRKGGCRGRFAVRRREGGAMRERMFLCGSGWLPGAVRGAAAGRGDRKMRTFFVDNLAVSIFRSIFVRS